MPMQGRAVTLFIREVTEVESGSFSNILSDFFTPGESSSTVKRQVVSKVVNDHEPNPYTDINPIKAELYKKSIFVYLR